MLIKELCNLHGVSGNETEVRNFIKGQIAPFDDEISVDTIGNLIALKKGDSSKKVMLSAHTDEVGFIISGINDKGFLEFKTVGGIDTRVLISKKVLVGCVFMQETLHKFVDIHSDLTICTKKSF